MSMITITIDGADLSFDASPAQVAALGVWRAGVMSALGASHPRYIADDIAYLQRSVQERVDQYRDDDDPNEAPQAVLDRVMLWLSGEPPGVDGDAPAEPLSPEAQRAALVAYASNKRWEVEVGGFVWNGITVPTDDRAKLLILGASQTMDAADTAPLIIGGVNYGSLTGAQFKALNAAIVGHVQATFPVLGAILADIASNTVITTDEIDAAAWPT